LRDAHFWKWISFGGRIGRVEYWLSYMLPSGMVAFLSGWGAIAVDAPGILVVGGLAAAWLFTVGHIKRFRDLKWPGFAGGAAMGVWWVVVAFLVIGVGGVVVTAVLLGAVFTGVTGGQWSPNLGPDLDRVVFIFVVVVAIPFLTAGFVPGVSAKEHGDHPSLGKVVKRSGVIVAALVGVPVIALGGYRTWHFFDQREPALIRAVHSAQFERVRTKLERGTDPNQRTKGGIIAPTGTTALELASIEGLQDIAAALLEHGADPTGRALVAAIERGDSALVEFIVIHGADVNTPVMPLELRLRDIRRNPSRCNQEVSQRREAVTPLMAAVATAQEMWMTALCSGGNRQSSLAARKADAAAPFVGVVHVLLRDGANDSSAFARAILDGHVAIAGAFLDHGWDINGVYGYLAEDGLEEGLPLGMAFRANPAEAMVRMLLERGADPTMRAPRVLAGTRIPAESALDVFTSPGPPQNPRHRGQLEFERRMREFLLGGWARGSEYPRWR
jgi:ankyrin repeat protein/uncharacterized membrane protein YhaH (DUF805 family)